MIRFFTVFILGGFSCNVMGDVLDSRQQMLDLAHTQAVESLSILDRRLTFCKQEEPIKVAQLKKIGLTKTQWGTAGGHLYLRAWMLCRGSAWIGAERALIHYFWLADQWLIATVPVTNPVTNLTFTSMADVTDIFYGDIEQKLESQIKFLTLSPALQKKLLSAPEFQQPFRPTASSDHWD